MKVSVNDPTTPQIEVFFNNQKLFNVVEADDEAGYVDVAIITFDPETKAAVPVKDTQGRSHAARLYGTVVFVPVEPSNG